MGDRKSEISWHSDAAGMVIGARIHDGHLSAIAYSDRGSLQLTARRISGDYVELELSGVECLGVVGFRNGAILGEIFVWKMADLSPQNLGGMSSAVRTLFGNDLSLSDATKEVEKLIRDFPNALLVYVSCCYGGELAATCGKVTMFELAGSQAHGGALEH